jgi:hypothetical protein
MRPARRVNHATATSERGGGLVRRDAAVVASTGVLAHDGAERAPGDTSAAEAAVGAITVNGRAADGAVEALGRRLLAGCRR